MSNDSGEYRLELLPGTYRIRVQGRTFTLVPAEPVFIESRKETRQDLILTLHELVKVAALAPDTTPAASNPGMSTRVVEAKEIEDREASSFVGARLGERTSVRVVFRGETGSVGTPGVWNLGSGTTLKASAGMGLKEPSLEQSFGGSFRIQGNPELLPERSRTLDAGIGKSFLDGRLWTEGTGFYPQYRDRIVLGDIDVPEFATEFTELTLEERQEIRRQIRAGRARAFRVAVGLRPVSPALRQPWKNARQRLRALLGWFSGRGSAVSW